MTKGFGIARASVADMAPPRAESYVSSSSNGFSPNREWGGFGRADLGRCYPFAAHRRVVFLCLMGTVIGALTGFFGFSETLTPRVTAESLIELRSRHTSDQSTPVPVTAASGIDDRFTALLPSNVSYEFQPAGVDGLFLLRITAEEEGDALRIADELACRHVKAFGEGCEPIESKKHALQLRLERTSLERTTKDGEEGPRDRSELAGKISRLRLAKDGYAGDLPALREKIDQFNDPSSTLYADAWARFLNDRRAATKVGDALLNAAISEQTSSAKEYWAELGAGKTEEHKDVALARRRLTTAKLAISAREAEIDESVSLDLEKQREIFFRRLVAETQLSLRLVQQREDEISVRIREAEAALGELDEARVRSTASKLRISEIDYALAKLQVEALHLDTEPQTSRVMRAASIVSRTEGRRGWLGISAVSWALFGGGLGASLAGVGSRVVQRRQVALSKPPKLVDVLGSRLWGYVPIAETNIECRSNPKRLEVAIRSIRNRMLSIADRTPFFFSSADGSLASSKIICGLAASFAAVGRRVLLVDCNVHQPSIHVNACVSDSPGLAELIEGDVDVSSAVHDTMSPHIRVLPAGNFKQTGSDLVAWAGLPDFITTLADGYDFTLVDCPPLHACPETVALLASQTSVLVFGTDLPVSRFEEFEAVFQARDRQPLGCILVVSHSSVAAAARPGHEVENIEMPHWSH